MKNNNGSPDEFGNALREITKVVLIFLGLCIVVVGFIIFIIRGIF